jgi:hypothetical protein
VNTLITFFIRLLEAMFVIGVIGCVSSVIPMTAYRLFMVLFEPEDPNEELPPVQNRGSLVSSPVPQLPEPKEQSAQSPETGHRQLTAPLP